MGVGKCRFLTDCCLWLINRCCLFCLYKNGGSGVAGFDFPNAEAVRGNSWLAMLWSGNMTVFDLHNMHLVLL